MPILRTEYRNLETNTIRGGATGHGESLTDLESYLMPLESARNRALFDSGVLEGLAVGVAAPTATDLLVSTGTALDGQGRLILLPEGGYAVTDPTVSATDVQNVPLSTAGAGGVTVPAPTTAGTFVVLISWREVAGSTGTFQRIHAPWLRLIAADAYTPQQNVLVLGLATWTAVGQPPDLATGSRRLAGQAARAVLRLGTSDVGGGPGSGQIAAELAARPGRGLELTIPGAGTDAALEVDSSGTVSLAYGLRTAGLELADSPAPNGFRLVSSAGRLAVRDLATDQERLSIDPDGRVGIGASNETLQRTLQVTGMEIHSAGSGAGFSFADRQVDTFVESPDHGERWVWYAADGAARLWSGTDRVSYDTASTTLAVAGTLRVTGDAVVGAGGNGVLTLRHINGKSGQDDGADDLFLNWATGRGVHVGGGQPAGLFVHGDVAAQSLNLAAAGTLSSPGRLHISGGEILFLLNKSGVIISKAWGGTGNLRIEGLLQGDVQVEGAIGTYGRHPINGLPTGWGGGVHTWDVFAQGSIGAGPAGVNGDHVPAGLNASGVVWGRQKRFVIEHPLDPDRRLVHAAIEGPETAVYYRGLGQLTDGGATVSLPDYFEALTLAEGRTVQITPIADSEEPAVALAAGIVVDGAFGVRALDAEVRSNQRFYWEVKAVRADLEPLEVEPDSTPTPVPDSTTGRR